MAITNGYCALTRLRNVLRITTIFASPAAVKVVRVETAVIDPSTEIAATLMPRPRRASKDQEWLISR